MSGKVHVRYQWHRIHFKIVHKKSETYVQIFTTIHLIDRVWKISRANGDFPHFLFFQDQDDDSYDSQYDEEEEEEEDDDVNDISSEDWISHRGGLRIF